MTRWLSAFPLPTNASREIKDTLECTHSRTGEGQGWGGGVDVGGEAWGAGGGGCGVLKKREGGEELRLTRTESSLHTNGRREVRETEKEKNTGGKCWIQEIPNSNLSRTESPCGREASKRCQQCSKRAECTALQLTQHSTTRHGTARTATQGGRTHGLRQSNLVQGDGGQLCVGTIIIIIRGGAIV